MDIICPNRKNGFVSCNFSDPPGPPGPPRPRFVASGDVDALDGTRVMLVQGARYELGTAEPEDLKKGKKALPMF